MVNWLMDGLVEWLTGRMLDLLGGLLAFLTSSMFLSPDVTVLPQVTTIAGKSSMVVNACFILAIIAVGITTMVGGSVEIRYSIKDLVPRLVVGLVLSNFAVPLCAVLIGIANSLTTSMVGTATPTTQTVTMARAHVAVRDHRPEHRPDRHGHRPAHRRPDVHPHHRLGRARRGSSDPGRDRSGRPGLL